MPDIDHDDHDSDEDQEKKLVDAALQYDMKIRFYFVLSPLKKCC